MITFLDGKLTNALPTQAIVDVNGVGHELSIPLSSYHDKHEMGPVRLIFSPNLHIRKDAHAHSFLDSLDGGRSAICFSLAGEQC